MKLARLSIKNFGCIGAAPVEVKIDKIVVLIGPNNVGKSTILRAYEVFAAQKQALEQSDFHNETAAAPVEIEGTFSDLTAGDLEAIGKDWAYDDAELGLVVRVLMRWKAPGTPGEKLSFAPASNAYAQNGTGGWASIFASRLPEPLAISPYEQADKVQDRILKVLTAALSKSLEGDGGAHLSDAIANIKKLAESARKDAAEDLDRACKQIQAQIQEVFPAYEVSIAPGVDPPDVAKLIAGGSQVRVGVAGAPPMPLGSQGTGFQRTFLWAALRTLAEVGVAKKGKGKKEVTGDIPRILLIEEPESYLHPPAVRAAREALYKLAEFENWQVLLAGTRRCSSMWRRTRPPSCG